MELFDICNDEGVPTGETVERSIAHRDGIPHRTVHIWITRDRDGQRQILLQQRSFQKDSFPGLFDTSSAGHLLAGDEAMEGAMRELEEELGIKALPEQLHFAGTFHIAYEVEFHGAPFKDNEVAFVYVYEGDVDIRDLTLQEEEVIGVEWFDLETVYEEVRLRHRERFCVPIEGLDVLKKYLSRRRLEQQLAFALEIDKEKNIFRQTHLSGHGRNENDAEHAWHMAIMAYLLKEYSNEPVDIAKVMLMCLLHDIVEIDAGDTYAYDEEALKTQKLREDAAKERIFSLLPSDQKEELIKVFDEFEAYETPESKFAHVMDNFQPLILNDSNDGGDWKAHEVTAEQVYGRQKNNRLGSERLFEETDRILKKHMEQGSLK